MKTITTLLTCLAFISLWAQDEITLVPLATGLNAPLNIQNAGDERLFVVEQGGVIKIVNPDGSINATPFLDISGQISSGGERGLLGLAFHPDYENNGYFYLYFTQPDGDTQVSRFSVDPVDPNIADPASELFLLDISQPFSNHNGGCIAFGPDGYLYIATGDGGSAGDPNNSAQNTSLLLGKMLRIDVDNPSGGLNYGIPADNPFAGSSSEAEEIWAYGLRNPWKFSFDRDTGDLWIADVGQNAIEEINHVSSSDAGLNYGWRCYEGSQIYNNTGCPDPSELTFPVAEYTHAIGSSITGGYVYRGTNEFFFGKYFFADFVTGIIGFLDENNDITYFQDLATPNWATFGEDIEGNLYIAAFNGTVYKIEPVVLSNDIPSRERVSIFPNPAEVSVTIQTPAMVIQEIRIYNLQGKRMMESTAGDSNTHTLSVESLASGFYLMEVSLENGNRVTEKLVIK